MQILLNIPEANFEDECSPVFACKERAKLEKLYNHRPQDDVEVVNIGPGADWLVLLTTTATTSWTLFQLLDIASREREFAVSLSDTDKIKYADPFRKSLNNDYSRQVCFLDYIIEEIEKDLDKAKAWVKSQTPLWGKQSNKAIALWAQGHQEDVATFQNELEVAYYVFAQAYELEVID